MDNEALRDAYLVGHPSLQGRVMFTSSGEGQPDGAILKVNDPTQTARRSRSSSPEGYIVRTRADADLVDARANDTTHRDLALRRARRSSTPTSRPTSRTSQRLHRRPSGPAWPGRCNPVDDHAARPATAAAVVEAN